MAKANIATLVTELITPTVEALGFQVWDVEYGKEGADYHLTVTIDSPNGVDIEGCEAVHRAIDPLLDEADPIEDSYYLNVSSPGLERSLRTDAHILASIGQRCEAKLFAPLQGTKTLRGTLSAYEGGEITMETEKGTVKVARADVSKMKILFFD